MRYIYKDTATTNTIFITGGVKIYLSHTTMEIIHKIGKYLIQVEKVPEALIEQRLGDYIVENYKRFAEKVELLPLTR